MLLSLFVRAALRVFPRRFRARHGRALAQTFAEDWRRNRPRARVALAADLLAAGLAERRAARAGRALPARPGWSPVMSQLSSDVVHAWRALVHRPGFALITVATLAVGLGATIAMFSVVDAVLLRPLPYPQDDRLVSMTEHQPARNLSGVSLPGFVEWTAFPEVASGGAYTAASLVFNENGAPESLSGYSVSPGFFATLGIAPALGRLMQPGEPFLDPAPKIVLGHALWTRQFGGNASVIGRLLILNGKPYQVAGVMPQGFAFPAASEFWTTLPANMRMLETSRDVRFVDVVARLKPDATIAAVGRRLAEWKQRVDLAGNADADVRGRAWQPSVTSLRDDIVGPVGTPLVVVFAGVWLLLLVACANAVALVMARGRSRLRDFAVQSALGAGRATIIRQLLSEGLIVSGAGTAVALAIAALTRDGIVALSANQIPLVGGTRVDVRVLTFAAIAAVLTTLIVSLGPALAVSRRPNADLLQQGSRSATAGAGGRRLFGALVAIEFALSLILAAAAGLLIASYARLTQVDLGFQPASVMAARVDIPVSPAWSGDAKRRQLHDDLLARVRAIAGVTDAGIVTRLPLSQVAGGTDAWPDDRPGESSMALLQLTSERYFSAIGARLLRGRDFTASDTIDAPGVAVVNDVVADKMWPGRDPVGHTITYQFMTGPQTVTVVGVVHALRYNGLSGDARGEIYVTFRQNLNTPSTLVFKAAADPSAAVPAVRAALAEIDPARVVTLNDISTLDTRLARTLARPRFYLVLVGVFSSVALVLAALGIYGTMTFWIGERWREFGIRIALGATRADVARLILGRGLAAAGAGIGVGLTAAVAARRVMSSLLFQVSPGDWRVIGAAIALLALCAAVAAVVPARRVSRLDPVVTMKGE